MQEDLRIEDRIEKLEEFMQKICKHKDKIIEQESDSLGVLVYCSECGYHTWEGE